MADTPLINFNVQRGDDDPQLIEFFVYATQVALPLTEIVEILFTIREGWALNEADDTDAVYSASLANGKIVAYSANGVIVALPAAVTVLMTFDKYVYDVQVLLTNGQRVTTQRGFVYMLPDVSRG